jgi:hypothetical protein
MLVHCHPWIMVNVALTCDQQVVGRAAQASACSGPGSVRTTAMIEAAILAALAAALGAAAAGAVSGPGAE